MADFLGSYAARFGLPVRTGVTVDRLFPHGDRFVVSAGGQRFESDNVVVAMADARLACLPLFAEGFVPIIRQIHSRDCRNPLQLRDGSVLFAGAGTSGADIAM